MWLDMIVQYITIKLVKLWTMKHLTLENREMMEEYGDMEVFYICVEFTHICESRSTVTRRGSPRLTYA
jgi:hypothetical protein